MIGKERRGETDGQVKSLITVGGRQEPSRTFATLSTPIGTLRLNAKHISFLAAIVAFVAILKIPVVSGGEANRCLAILVFATILWATEVSSLCNANIFVRLLIVYYLLRSGDPIVRDFHLDSIIRRCTSRNSDS